MCAAPSAGPLMKALILVDISIHNEPKGIDRIVEFMTGKREFATLDEVGGLFASTRPQGSLQAAFLRSYLSVFLQRTALPAIFLTGLGPRTPLASSRTFVGFPTGTGPGTGTRTS